MCIYYQALYNTYFSVIFALSFSVKHICIDIILFLSIVSTFFVYLYECCLIYPQYGQGDK